jgi:hypothetical protein
MNIINIFYRALPVWRWSWSMEEIMHAIDAWPADRGVDRQQRPGRARPSKL